MFVADLFHPVNDLPVEVFLNGNVRHGRGGRGAVPMLFPWRKPYDIAGTDFFNRAALALRTASPGRDYQGLPQWMRVPGRAGTGFKGDTGADAARRRRLFETGGQYARCPSEANQPGLCWRFVSRFV